MDSVQAAAFSAELIGKTVGGWLVEGTLGHGKSAVVLKATKDGTAGALKVFHPELVERYGEHVQIERINRERSLIGVEHSNLVRIYDGGKCASTGYLFVVMEVVPFNNLRQVLHEVPIGATRSIVAQLAKAAHFLEQRGLVHRDIKPENIAISPDFSHVKLLDMGVMLPVGVSGLTDLDHRTFIGTLRYSSPEFLQRKEKPTTEGWRAVTFYQIGAVLHDLIVRKEIFSAQSEPYSVLVDAVLRTVPDVYGDDAKLVRLCNHCLVKNPDTRLLLLSWNDFSDNELADDVVKVAKDRIQARQKYFRSQNENAGVTAGEHERLMQQGLTALCHQLEVQLGIIFVEHDYFPLRKTVTAVNTSGHLSINFQISAQLGLPSHLSIHLVVNLADHNDGSPIYSVTGGAVLAATEPEPGAIPATKAVCFGTAEQIVTDPAIADFLIASLDGAYEYLEVHGQKEVEKLTTL
jgi:serine/threonine protein kinase